MKILIHALQFADHVTGTDRIARNVLEALQRIDTVNEYRVMCMRGRPFVPEVITAPNFKIEWVPPYRRRHPLYWLFRGVQESRRAAWAPDLYFSFHNFWAPWAGRAKMVISDLDLIPLHYPSQYLVLGPQLPWARRLLSDRLRQRLYRKRINTAVDRADHIVAISEFSKADLLQHFQVSPERVTVAHLAPEPRFFDAVSSTKMAEVRSKYRLPERFVLAIGATEPRKNAKMVIQAYSKLPQALRDRYKLVVMGPAWHHVKPEDLVGGSGDIFFTGFVADTDLPALYRASDLFVFPSLYEGFGLPVLEAMASGVPVICSNTTSLPEIVGEAAITVDPHDVDGLASRIGDVLASDDLRRRLRAEGRSRAEGFGWNQTAARFHEVFMRVGEPATVSGSPLQIGL